MPLAQDLLVAIIGIVASVYLLNLTAGIIELIPDNMPLLGNLDEAGATALVLYALRYFGVDVMNLINDILNQAPRQPRRRL